MNPVIIIWHDAHAGEMAWTPIEELDILAPCVVQSVGWLLDKGKGGKVNHWSVCQSFTEDGQVDSVLHIPRKMVVKIVSLSSDEVGRVENIE